MDFDLSLIPTAWIAAMPHWLIAVLLVLFGVPGAASWLVGAAKWCTGDPKPTDSTAKRV